MIRALSLASPWASDETPALEVRLHGPELARVARGSRVLLRVAEDELAWLNMYRPLFADLELRAVLWAPTRAYDRLVREASDLASWILQDLPLPARALPEFAIAGVAAAIEASAPFGWRGPGLEDCLQACGDVPWFELSVDSPFVELVARLRDSGLPIITKVDDEARAWRVRMAMALAGRSDAWIARDPARPLAAMPCLHAEQDDWDAAALRLREAGWRRPELMAAWVELEPEAIREACETGDRAPRDPGEFGVEAIARGEVPIRVWRARVGDADVCEARGWGEGPEAQLHRALIDLGEKIGSEALIDEAVAIGFVDVAMVLALRRWDAGESTDASRLIEWLEARGDVARALTVAQAWMAGETDERERAWAMTWLGDLHRALGKGQLALRFFEDSLAIRKQLVEREPGRADLLRDLAVSYDHLGVLALAEGELEFALRYFDDSLATRKQLVEREPGRADLLRDLSFSYDKLGDIHRYLGKTELARTYYEDSLAIQKQLVEREPGRADLLRDLSHSYGNLGNLHLALGDGLLARRYFDDSLAIARQLVEDEPDRADLLRDLSDSYHNLGDLHRAMGKGQLALRYFEDDLAIRKQLVEREPANADLRRDLATSFARMATVDPGRAVEWLGQSLGIRRAICEGDPSNAIAKRGLAIVLLQIADATDDMQARREGYAILRDLRSRDALETAYHPTLDRLATLLDADGTDP